LREADGFGRNFDELVVGDEFDRLFEAEFAVRNEANGLVGGDERMLVSFFSRVT